MRPRLLLRGAILTRSVSEEIGCEASLTLRVSVRTDRVAYKCTGRKSHAVIGQAFSLASGCKPDLPDGFFRTPTQQPGTAKRSLRATQHEKLEKRTQRRPGGRNSQRILEIKVKSETRRDAALDNVARFLKRTENGWGLDRKRSGTTKHAKHTNDADGAVTTKFHARDPLPRRAVFGVRRLGRGHRG